MDTGGRKSDSGEEAETGGNTKHVDQKDKPCIHLYV